MAMASGTLKDVGNSTRRNPNPPGLRQQLRCVSSIYQTLTNLYFLLIEQNSSTGMNVSTKNALLQQMNDLLAQVRGPETAAVAANPTNARPQARNQQHSRITKKAHVGAGISNDLRPEHSKRIKEIPLFAILIRSSATLRNSSSSSSSVPNLYIPSLGQAIEAIEELDAILLELMQRADQHAINQAKIRQLVHQIEEGDNNMVQSIRRLSVLRERCNRLVKLGKEEEESIEIAEKKPLGFKEILQYARTLSQTTTAPPGFKLPLDEYSDQIQPPQEGAEGDPANRPKPTKKLYQLAQENEEESEAGSNRISARYQNKLPFPSVDAIRRGASIIQPATWEMFQKGILQVDQEIPTANEEQMEEEQPEQYHQSSHVSAPTQYQRRPQPVEEEEDGFGLDLN